MRPALIPEIQVETEPDDNGGDAQGDGGKDDDVNEDHDPLSREMESSDDDHE